jgi:hypothetical protein
VAGYYHTLDRSRLAIGTGVHAVTEFGMQKMVGSNGVFAVLSASGWSMGLPNATAPSRSVGPLTSDADIHNAAVKSYFIGAGLPADQIGWVNAHATMSVSDAPASEGGSSPPAFQSFTTAISRQINGIPVSESFAWARLNQNGDVVIEGVYWPDVPQTAVNDALALQSVLADSTQSVTYKAKLPQTLAPGRVIIHHMPCVGGINENIATYDVWDGGRDRHFNIAGAEVLLAADTIPIAPNTPKYR